MKKFKKIYFVLLLIIVFMLSAMYFSYAFFTSKNEEHGKLNIVVGTLEYKIESSDLQDNSITVSSGDTKMITLSVKSLNDVASKYELYYKLESDNDLVTVGFLEDSFNTKSGTLENHESKKIEVIIRNQSDSNQQITFGVKGGLINNNLVLSDNQKSLIDYCSKEDIYTFDYTGSEQEFNVPCSGQYRMELWGASGFENYSRVDPGLGAYTSGNIVTGVNQKLYIYVGSTSSYNAGGSGEAPGGGATDIRISNGEWSLFSSLKDRIMVAAGGGGAFYAPDTSNRSPGHGGGLIGYDANVCDIDSGILYDEFSGHGATQQLVGESGNIELTHPLFKELKYSVIVGGFGLASYGIDMDSHFYSSSGGGGYYGGGHGVHPGGTWTGGGGGSSFISGHSGCDAIKEESTETNIIHTGQSIHYSGLYFTDTIMIDGAGYNWTTEKGDDVVGMPTHDGTSTMIGNSGNGYAKITYLGK